MVSDGLNPHREDKLGGGEADQRIPLRKFFFKKKFIFYATSEIIRNSRSLPLIRAIYAIRIA